VIEGKIISVTPVDNYFSINWQLGIRCNYDCMYCPTEYHDSVSPHHSLETLQQAWHNLFAKTKHQGLPYKIAFTGGELTTNKHFLPFVTWLRENYNQHLFKILLTTNGSATLNYYKKAFMVIDNISFSVHSEHLDESKFFNMVVDLHKIIDSSNFIHVNIMDEFWNRDRIPAYIKLLQQHNISHNVNVIDYQLQTRTIPIFKGNLNLDI
jgi:molybdenum cofactor biosynthesis enzyme MoaA